MAAIGDNVLLQGCFYQAPLSTAMYNDGYVTLANPPTSYGAWTLTQNEVDIIGPNQGDDVTPNSLNWFASPLCKCGGSVDLNGSNVSPYNGILTQQSTSVAGNNYQITFDVSLFQ